MSENMLLIWVCVFFFCRYYYCEFCIAHSRVAIQYYSRTVVIIFILFYIFVALIFCDAFLFSVSLTHCVVSRSTSVIIITLALYFLCHAVNHRHWILFFSLMPVPSHSSLRNCNSFCRSSTNQPANHPTDSPTMSTTICLVVGINSFFSVKNYDEIKFFVAF